MFFAVQVYVIVKFSRMKDNVKVLMKYRYHNVWKEKYVKHIRGVRLHFLPQSERVKPELYQDIEYKKEKR